MYYSSVAWMASMIVYTSYNTLFPWSLNLISIILHCIGCSHLEWVLYNIAHKFVQLHYYNLPYFSNWFNNHHTIHHGIVLRGTHVNQRWNLIQHALLLLIIEWIVGFIILYAVVSGRGMEWQNAFGEVKWSAKESSLVSWSLLDFSQKNKYYYVH